MPYKSFGNLDITYGIGPTALTIDAKSIVDVSFDADEAAQGEDFDYVAESGFNTCCNSSGERTATGTVTCRSIEDVFGLPFCGDTGTIEIRLLGACDTTTTMSLKNSASGVVKFSNLNIPESEQGDRKEVGFTFTFVSTDGTIPWEITEA